MIDVEAQAISRSGSPDSTRLSASRAWCGVSLRGRPNNTPLARAAFKAAIAEKFAGRFTIRNRTRVAATPEGRLMQAARRGELAG